MAQAPSTLLPLRAADAPSSAPRGSPPLAGLIRLISFLLTIGNLPYWIFTYLVRRPVMYKNMLAFVLGRLAKTMSLMYPFLPAPEADGEAARPPAFSMGWTAELTDRLMRTVVAIQPVAPEWRTGSRLRYLVSRLSSAPDSSSRRLARVPRALNLRPRASGLSCTFMEGECFLP